MLVQVTARAITNEGFEHAESRLALIKSLPYPKIDTSRMTPEEVAATLVKQVQSAEILI